MSKQVDDVAPACNVLAAASADQLRCRNPGPVADRLYNFTDRYCAGDISQIFVPGYIASTNFFLSL